MAVSLLLWNKLPAFSPRAQGLLQRALRQNNTSMRAAFSKIGFIGLGNMGKPMAENVLSKGHNLVVYDVVPEAMTVLQKKGAKISKSPKEVASNADCIITMLPNSDHVLEAYNAENGILSSVQKGAVLIDSSTIDPGVSKSVSVAAESKGAVFLDAPVSGGVNAAKAAQLTFMVGGSESMFAKTKDMLLTMGARVVHCGPVGSGQSAKICNNMLLGISMLGTAEAMNLGIKLGLDAKVLMEIINSSSGRCWSSEVYNPVPGTLSNVPSANNYEGGFGAKLMAKDLGLAQNAATKTKTPTPLGSLTHQLYRIMIQRGYANKDFSSIYQFLKEENKK